jgi:hypothetical protein
LVKDPPPPTPNNIKKKKTNKKKKKQKETSSQKNPNPHQQKHTFQCLKKYLRSTPTSSN